MENRNLNIPQSQSKRIVIVGGGFAGLALARKLAGTSFQVVLLDRNNFHLFQPLLYQVATSALDPQDIIFPFRKVFHRKKNIHFRMAQVVGVNPGKNSVTTDQGEIGYDILVLANGSTSNFFGMDDVERNAVTMKEITDSLAIRNHFYTNVERAVTAADPDLQQALLNVVIAGGGPTGVELAGALAEIKKYIMRADYPDLDTSRINIYLVEGQDRLMGTMSEKTSSQTLKLLSKMGVKVLLGTMVTGYENGKVLFKDGEGIPTLNLIWTSGVKVVIPPGLPAAIAGKGGRALTDLQFRVKGFENVYVIGDAALVQGDKDFPGGYPQLAREAIAQASHLAHNLKRMERGKPAEDYRHVVYPVMATVGRNHAFAEYKNWRTGGFFGWLMWAFVHLIQILGVRNKFNVFTNWIYNYFTFDHPSRVVIDIHQTAEKLPVRNKPATAMPSAADSIKGAGLSAAQAIAGNTAAADRSETLQPLPPEPGAECADCPATDRPQSGKIEIRG